MRKEKGSIAIFVLVALLFMSAFLIISFASNVNKSKTLKEQFNIISGIYSYANGEEGAYDKAYSDLRNKNKQTMTASSENSDILELTKTFDENISNYRIYGNSVQSGTPTPDNPVGVQSIGNLVTDTTDANYGKNIIPIKITGSNVARINDGKLENIYCAIYGIPVKKDQIITYIVNYTNNSSDSNNNLLPRLYSDQSLSTVIEDYNSITSGNDIIRTITMTSDGYFTFCFGYEYTTIEFNKLFVGSGKFDIKDYKPYQEQTCNIILDNPLRKIGDSADYIDFKTGKVVRYVGKIDSYNGEEIKTEWISETGELSTGATVYYVLETPIEETVILPQLKSFEDYTKIEVLTSVAPSKIEVEYMGYTLE